jgi:hypothetical protein
VTSIKRLIFSPTERMIFFRTPKKDCLHLGRDAVPGEYARGSEKRSSRKPISRILYRTRNRGRYSLFLSILV